MTLLAFVSVKARVAEDEPEKAALKRKASFSRKEEKRLSDPSYSSQPNLMFPVSRRELAPASRDI
jgi:hypothetical protein